MRRTYDIAVAVCGFVTVVLLLVFTASAWAQSAPAASAPAPAASAPALTLDTACGAPGIGLDLGGNLIKRPDGMPGLRVDALGRWDWCKMPEPPKDCRAGLNGTYSWRVGEHSCVGTGVPDHMSHGLVVSLLNSTGPNRGAVGLMCRDGALSHVYESCAPATECDNSVALSSDGGKTVYTYDARPQSKRVPLGGFALAVAADGSSIRVQCVAGSFVRAPEQPVVAPPVRPAKPVTCGPQTATGWVAPRYTRVRYAGLSVPVGTVVQAEGAQLICGPDGKLTQDPSVVPADDPNNPWNRK